MSVSRYSIAPRSLGLRSIGLKLTGRNIGFLLFSLSLFAMMASPIRALIAYALDWENTDASQVVVIPLISATVIFLNRKNIFGAVRYAVVPALALFMTGSALLLAARRLGPGLLEGDRLAFWTSSLVVLWLGGFVLFYGPRAFRTALFPLLFLFFCVPIPSPVLNWTISVLQHRSADMAFFLFKATGTPVFRQGVIFTLPDLVIEVAPQCSGIRSGISLLILSLVAGHMMLKSLWRRTALILIAIPILIFKNALRIATLSLLTIHVDKRILESRLHQEGGIPFFVLGLVLLYPIFSMLIKSERGRSPVMTPGTEL